MTNYPKELTDLLQVYMADGVIEEMGTPQEVFDNPKSEKTRAFLHGIREGILEE